MKFSLLDLNKKIDENILSIVLIIGVIQALMVNFLRLQIPLLTLFVFFDIGFKAFISSYGHKLFTINRTELVFSLSLIVLVFYGALVEFASVKDFFYLVNVPIIMVWAGTLNISEDHNYKTFFKLLIIYSVITLIIYLFFWSQLASIFYGSITNGSEHGLRTSGIKRSYGLLFNPLANAYTLLIGLCIYLYIKPKFNFLFFFLSLSLFLCLVRLSMVSFALIILFHAFYWRKYGFLSVLVLLVIICYITIDPVRVIINNLITLSDSQGSIQLHVNHFFYGLEFVLYEPLGLGVVDKHIESWIFKYSIHFGLLGILLISSWFLTVTIEFLFKRKNYELVVFCAYLPIFIGIPFNEFNLPLTMFFIMLRIFQQKTVLHV